MADLIGEIEKGIKKVTDFLEITPTEHHSIVEPPYGRPKDVLGRKTVWGKQESNPHNPKPEKWRPTPLTPLGEPYRLNIYQMGKRRRAIDEYGRAYHG